jgi:hypothetical protein
MFNEDNTIEQMPLDMLGGSASVGRGVAKCF